MITSEITRVQQHLDGALAMLAARDVRGLDRAQRLTRMLLVQELAGYRDGGRFPQNHDHPSTRPSFIDEHGTRCAMAHLMELGGASALVEEVARTANHAYVETLAADPRFLAWLAAAGLTVAEAARIQPQYCMSAAATLCLVAPQTAGQPAPGVFEATMVPHDAGTIAARVDAVYGDVPHAVGSTVTVWSAKVPLTVGDRVLVTVDGGSFDRPPSSVIARIEADGQLGAACGNGAWADPTEIGLITLTEVLALRDLSSRAACSSALYARDQCFSACIAHRTATGQPTWPPYECVYGIGYVDPKDAGAKGAAATDASVDAGSAPDASVDTADTGSVDPSANVVVGSRSGGCASTGTDVASASSIAVLLAVAGALVARQRRSRS